MSTIHITIGTSQNGKACGTGDYEVGSQATLVATPDSGYVFVTWDDGVTLNPRTVNATANATYKAEFDGTPTPPTPTPSNVIRYNAPTAVLGSWVATCTDTTRNTYDTSTGDGVLYLNSGVTTIGGGTSLDYSPFYNKTDLVSVELGSQITTIGIYAFISCTALTSITIPNSVTVIGATAFGQCTALTSITIPNSVMAIGNSAFVASGLTSVTIPSSVSSIGSNPFSTCNDLASITVDQNNTHYNDGNGSNCIIKTSNNTLVVGCKNTVIPNSVTTIDNYAFSNCNGLTSIAIPNSVTTIGSGAFYYSGLTSVSIGSSVTSIGYGAFEFCTGLTSITIPNSVTSIGNYAFQYCSGLTSATIGSGMTSIGKEAFDNCSNLTTVTCYATTPPALSSWNFTASNDTLKVPSASLSAYQSNSDWSSAFTTITSI